MIISTLIKYIVLFAINIAIPSLPLIYLFFIIKKRNYSRLDWENFEEGWGQVPNILLFVTTSVPIIIGFMAVLCGIITNRLLSDAEIFSIICSHKKYAIFWFLLVVLFITKTLLKKRANKEK